MKTRILAFLLHHANRCAKDFARGQFAGDFYRVKDAILRKYGNTTGYDIQHIEGKKCFKCSGTGLYSRWDGCWACGATGWFKDPQWICLQRIQFHSYEFHKPLKRERVVANPFTKETLGWNVSDRPVIIGYVRHQETWISRYALALIMLGTPDFPLILKRIIKEWRWYWWGRLLYRLKKVFLKKKPAPATMEEYETSDLPF